MNMWEKLMFKFSNSFSYFGSPRTSLALGKEVGCLVHCVSVIKSYCNCVLQHQISQMTIQTRYQINIWNSRDLKMPNFCCYLIDTNNETSPAILLYCCQISSKVRPHFKNWRSVPLFSLIKMDTQECKSLPLSKGNSYQDKIKFERNISTFQPHSKYTNLAGRICINTLYILKRNFFNVLCISSWLIPAPNVFGKILDLRQ